MSVALSFMYVHTDAMGYRYASHRPAHTLKYKHTHTHTHVLLQSAGRPSVALTQFEDALIHCPDHIGARYHAGLMLYSLGEHSQAEKAVSEVPVWLCLWVL